MHLAAESQTHARAVTALRAALATKWANACIVIDRIERLLMTVASKQAVGAVALLRCHKLALKQLQLLRTVSGVTASQMLVIACLIDSMDASAANTDCGDLISVALTSHRCNALARQLRARELLPVVALELPSKMVQFVKIAVRLALLYYRDCMFERVSGALHCVFQSRICTSLLPG